MKLKVLGKVLHYLLKGIGMSLIEASYRTVEKLEVSMKGIKQSVKNFGVLFPEK